MKRNVYKVINETHGKINPYYAMSYSEAGIILESCNDTARRIFDSFTFGYAMGLRAATKEVASR